MRMALTRTVAIALMTVAGGGVASADAVLQSLQQLIAGDYEIKSVTPVPADMMPALGRKPGDAPEVLISLQRGRSFAVCELAIANWNALPKTTLENAQLCSVWSETGAAAPAAGPPAAADAPAPAAAPAAPGAAPSATAPSDEEQEFEIDTPNQTVPSAPPPAGTGTGKTPG